MTQPWFVVVYHTYIGANGHLLTFIGAVPSIARTAVMGTEQQALA